MGETFGRYELLERIGRGGMAEVHKARYSPTPGVTKMVVLKRILSTLAERDDFRQMFVSEARLTTRLSHGNVVQVFDAGEVNGEPFLAMEWVDGVGLDAVLERVQQKGFDSLPPELAVLIAIDVLRGLHHAHTRVGDDARPLRLVHRDVSPDNILLSYEGQVKVTDFGIAKAALEGRLETRPGIFKGKLSYGAPEQLRAEPVDARADVYSVGLVLYEMLQGQNPVAQTAVAVATGVAQVPLLPEWVAGPELSVVLATATQVKPSQRYHTALAFQEALTQWVFPRAGAHAANGLHQLMAWLFGDELRARGLDASLDDAARRWLELTRARPRPPVRDSTVRPSRAALDPVPTTPASPSKSRLPPAPAAPQAGAGDTLPPSQTLPAQTLPPARTLADALPPSRTVDEAPATLPPMHGVTTTPSTRLQRVGTQRRLQLAAGATALLLLVLFGHSRWAAHQEDEAALAHARDAFSEKDFAGARRFLDPLLHRDSPSAEAGQLSHELDEEAPAGEALAQAQRLLEAAAAAHAAPDDAKLGPLFERASHSRRFQTDYLALKRNADAARAVDGERLGRALAAFDEGNFAEVRRLVPCLLPTCSNDWLAAQLTQERQVRSALDSAEKLITGRDFKGAEDLLDASGRTLFQAERRKDLFLRLEGDREALAPALKEARPKPRPAEPDRHAPSPPTQDQVLLEGARRAIAAKDYPSARSMLHDCLVVAPKQAECERLLRALP